MGRGSVDGLDVELVTLEKDLVVDVTVVGKGVVDVDGDVDVEVDVVTSVVETEVVGNVVLDVLAVVVSRDIEVVAIVVEGQTIGRTNQLDGKNMPFSGSTNTFKTEAYKAETNSLAIKPLTMT